MAQFGFTSLQDVVGGGFETECGMPNVGGQVGEVEESLRRGWGKGSVRSSIFRWKAERVFRLRCFCALRELGTTLG